MTQIEICFNSFSTEIDRLGLAGERWIELRRKGEILGYLFRVVGKPFEPKNRCTGWSHWISADSFNMKDDCLEFGIVLGNIFNEATSKNELR